MQLPAPVVCSIERVMRNSLRIILCCLVHAALAAQKLPAQATGDAGKGADAKARAAETQLKEDEKLRQEAEREKELKRIELEVLKAAEARGQKADITPPPAPAKPLTPAEAKAREKAHRQAEAEAKEKARKEAAAKAAELKEQERLQRIAAKQAAENTKRLEEERRTASGANVGSAQVRHQARQPATVSSRSRWIPARVAGSARVPHVNARKTGRSSTKGWPSVT